MENIIENNKLIAEFMDGKMILENYHGLKYHSSWNWLMPVVEKIESMESLDVDILTSGTRIYEWKSGGRVVVDTLANISFVKKIEHTYTAIIEFIKWYNQQER